MNLVSFNDIKQIEHYNKWEKENINFFKENFCLKKIQRTRRFDFNNVKNKLIDIGADEEDLDVYKKESEFFLEDSCLLEKGHSGKCSCSYKGDNKIIDNMINTTVQSSPGNSGLYKNRIDRTYPIFLSMEKEVSLFQKQGQPESIFIPSRDRSRPLMLLTAKLTMLSFFKKMNFSGLESSYSERFINLLDEVFNKTVYSKKGYVSCFISGDEIKQEYFNLERYDENKVHLGHLIARKNDLFTIRGDNIVLCLNSPNVAWGSYDFDKNSIEKRISDLQKIIDNLKGTGF